MKLSAPSTNAPTPTNDLSHRSGFAFESAVYLLAGVLARAVSFLLVPLYTRLLSQDELGSLTLGNTYVALLSLVLGFGTHAALSRQIPSLPATEHPAWLRAALQLQLLAMLLLFVPGLGALRLVAPSVWPWSTMVALYLAAAGSVLVGTLTQYLVSLQRARSAALANLSVAGLQVVVAMVCVMSAPSPSAQALFLANGAVMSLLGVGAIGWTLKKAWAATGHAEAQRWIFFYAWPVVLHLVANWVLSVSDRVLIERELNARELAVYGVAYLFNIAVVTFGSALAQALGPRFVQYADQHQHEALQQLARRYVLLLTGVALVGGLFARFWLSLVAPLDSYSRALPWVPWLLVAGWFQGVYFLLSQGSWYAGRTLAISVVTASMATLNVSLNLVLIPWLGGLGAAVSTAVSYAALMLFHDRLSQRGHRVPWPYDWLFIGFASLVVGLFVAAGVGGFAPM